MKRIMLIPANQEIVLSTVAQQLVAVLRQQQVTVALLPALEQSRLEQHLSHNSLDDLLLALYQDCLKVGVGCEYLIITGLELNWPYAAQINALIAQALAASTILVVGNQESVSAMAQTLKIAARPYAPTQLSGFLSVDHHGWHADVDNLRNLGSVAAATTDPVRTELILGRTLQSTGMTPTLFKQAIFQKAQAANKRIILPEGNEPRTIQAAHICAARGLATPILLGSRAQIIDYCQKIGLILHDRVEICEEGQPDEKYAHTLYTLRKSKGMTLEDANQQVQKNNIVLGTLMLQLGEVDGLVSGAIHTTADTIRPALQIIRTAPGSKIVSSVFFMCLPEQVLIYGDCAINPQPSAEELADIALQSAASAALFGIEPRVALLSYSTGSSGFGPAVDKINAAVALIKQRAPQLLVDGPLQYDAAVDPVVAALKAPQSPVAGRATVFIFPDLNVGNITYKAVQRSTGTISIGPMSQGLAKPVNDLSRGCSIEDIVCTIAVTAVQATQ